jgi:hypothetical protein
MITHRTRNEHELAPIEVRIPCASLTLEGVLAVPTGAEGSWSSRTVAAAVGTARGINSSRESNQAIARCSLIC